MQHLGYEGLIHDKKRRVDKISKDGWKLQSKGSNKLSWFNKLKRKVIDYGARHL
ncbi:hypothetical protein [Alkalihalobacterium elongatum]|uniref:hypothetical protein n=1 Tax=Alkalihalobacterium elongatum TaxID=2675466 RepID=UPI001C1F6F7B|nr:hypothetical protein [Alkalihalobacterium elongatum]